MSLAYPSGEEVRAGDRIRCAGEAGTVEFVAEAGNAERDEGCMVAVAPFGHVFFDAPQNEEDLEFVGRG